MTRKISKGRRGEKWKLEMRERKREVLTVANLWTPKEVRKGEGGSDSGGGRYIGNSSMPTA